MSILSGKAILAAIERGDIVCDPFRPEMVNPASIDLTLGDRVAFYAPTVTKLLDAQKENRCETYTFGEEGFILEQRRAGYLMHTVERIGSSKYVACLDGKSSLGRLFVQVHMTAGFGDPGFVGQWTLEVSSIYPVRLYPGMRIAQMRFHTVEGEIDLYRGNYGGDATGPVPSRSWKQFGG